MRFKALALIGLAVLAGCAVAPPRSVPPVASPVVVPQVPPSVEPSIGDRAAALAERYVGVPYQYGGRSPEGFDCSGLVWYVYHELGVSVPRTAARQRDATARVSSDALRRGDLVFFFTPKDHVGIYLGGGEFVHAPATGRTVSRARLDTPYFILGFAGGGRVTGP